MRTTLLPAVLLALSASPLPAQIDYRNLDHGRPLRTEDAYALERYAFELALPYELEREAGVSAHLLTPELTYGIARNTHLAVEWPLGAADGPAGTDWGLAGPRVSLLHNLNTEGPALPGLGIRGELAIPLGALAPEDPLFSVSGLATRSWGKIRAHLNAGVTLGTGGERGASAPPDWHLSGAVDRTLLRRSVLLLGELGVERAEGRTEVALAVGGRMQLAPTLVLDAGVGRGLGGDPAPELGLTIGLSHTFGVARLLPGVRR